MGVYKSLTRNRAVPGSLSQGAIGVVERSVGYLQGGYAGGPPKSQVQSFNTVTQVGTVVYDTGYSRYYTPGISGNLAGYFSINGNTDYNKFSFISASASASFSTGLYPSTSAVDLAYTASWLLCSTSASWTGAVADWVKINLTTDTPASQGNLSATPEGTTRQALGTTTAGFFGNSTNNQVISLDFGTNAVSTQSVTLLTTGIQYYAGLSVGDNHGYIVGFSGANVRLNVSGTTITSYSSGPAYTYNFGESHSLASATRGYMMAGYSDTTGRYGMAQHGLCQSMSITTEAITTLSDLAIAQSSGQMMTGF
jgi:hypothetical protein